MSKIGMILTGQSLALGGAGGDSVSDVTSPSSTGRCYMIGAQPVGRDTETLSSTVSQLVEDEKVTIGHSLTHNAALENAGNTYYFHGQAYGGALYSQIKKGGAYGTYEKIMDQIDDILTYDGDVEYDSVHIIHGEADGYANNHYYHNDLAEWLADFDADIKTKTGQTADVAMFIDQVNSASGYGKRSGIQSTEFPTALKQLKAHEQYGGIILVGPKYFLPYYDHAHITNMADRILGEYHWKAYKAFKENGSYNPLKPAKIYSSGNQVHIIFCGAIGGLSFDTTNVSSATNYGFDYHDLSGNTISSVAISGNKVVLTLSGTVGGNPWVSYAYQNGDTPAGEETNATVQADGRGERGNLRDNDTAVSVYNSDPLYNWCVTFKKPVQTTAAIQTWVTP